MKMNLDLDAIFRARLKHFSTELVRYGQYMANGGVLMVAVFLCGLFAYYYPGLVQAVPAWFPVPYALAAVFAFFVTRSPHRTFLQEADLLFLTPAETKMARYFRKTQVYNFAVQSVGVFLVLLLFLPLYQGTVGVSGAQKWWYWLIPLLLKGWNVYSSWIALRLPDRKQQRMYALARFCLTYFALAWMLSEGSFLTYRHIPYGVLAWALLLVWFHVRLMRMWKRHAYQWYRLLEMESGLRLRFYQIANQFRDVPSLQQRVKPRKWLVWVARLIPYKPANAGRLLLFTSFLRGGDLAGMYLRLVILSSLLVLMLPGTWAKAAVLVLFLLLSASQLKGIGNQARHRNRYPLLPINEQQQKLAARWVRRVLLTSQAALNILLWLAIAWS